MSVFWLRLVFFSLSMTCPFRHHESQGRDETQRSIWPPFHFILGDGGSPSGDKDLLLWWSDAHFGPGTLQRCSYPQTGNWTTTHCCSIVLYVSPPTPHPPISLCLSVHVSVSLVYNCIQSDLVLVLIIFRMHCCSKSLSSVWVPSCCLPVRVSVSVVYYFIQ